MITLVTIECQGCTWKQVIEPQKELDAGKLHMGAVTMDGYRIMCNCCKSTVFKVVDVVVRTP